MRLGTYVPNRLPLVQRFLYGAIALTWCAWAGTGLLSGHMFFMISRAGPIHFAGVAALLFSAAVLACTTAVVIALVDHFDTRDNEACYQSMRRWSWATSLAFFLTAGIVGASNPAFLPATASIGLATAEGLVRISSPNWLSDVLVTVRPVVSGWLLAASLWLIAGSLILKLFGFGAYGKRLTPLASILLIYVLMVPAFASFTLYLLCYLTSGEVIPHGVASDESQRAKLAFLHSILVMCAGVWLLLVIGTVILVLGAFGAFRIERTQLEARPSAH